MTSSPKNTVEVDVPEVSDATHLKSIIDDRDLSTAKFADSIGMEGDRLKEILAGDAKLDHSEATRIKREYDIPLSFWNDLYYDLSVAASEG